MGTAIIDARGPLVSISTLTPPIPPIVSGCIAYYKLDNDGSGGVSLVDSTGNGNTLTNEGGVTLGTGIIAGDGVFDGSSQYLAVNNATPFTSGNFSVSLWVNPSDLTNYLSIFGAGGSGGFAINSNANSGGIDVNDSTAASDISTTGNLSVGVWANIVVTNQSGVTSLYVNRVFQASTTQSMRIIANLNIGAVYNDFTWFNGQIDEVGVWNRALSNNEILALYNAGSGLTYPFTN
jgi:hypothetical protein